MVIFPGRAARKSILNFHVMPVLGPVYVIDDDSSMLDSTAFLLSSLKIESRAFGDPIAFLQKLPELEPGCILSDLSMPSMTGIELHCALVAKNVAWPMILMSGNSDLETNRHRLKKGIVGFLEKPFGVPALLQMLETASGEFARED